MRSLFSVFVFAIVLLLSACKPAPEKQAKKQAEAVEYQRQECLEKICSNDVEPKHDNATEQVFKRGGKWFIGPSEYGGYNGSFAFYWPSKTPGTKASAAKEAPEYLPSDPTTGRLSNFYDVAIEFFIETGEQQGEMYGLIEKAKAKAKIIKQEQLRPGLELVQIQSDPKIEPIETYYIATQLKTPAGALPTVHCRMAHPDNRCTSGFAWKPDYRIYVRFNQKHGKDWPEIYQEISRILNQIKGA